MGVRVQLATGMGPAWPWPLLLCFFPCWAISLLLASPWRLRACGRAQLLAFKQLKFQKRRELIQLPGFALGKLKPTSLWVCPTGNELSSALHRGQPRSGVGFLLKGKKQAVGNGMYHGALHAHAFLWLRSGASLLATWGQDLPWCNSPRGSRNTGGTTLVHKAVVTA